VVSAIKAFRRFHELIDKSSRLVIVGSGEEYNFLVSLCVELKISNAVDFLGYVTKKDLSESISDCKFLISPSLHEGFGLSTVEALSQGINVISMPSLGSIELLCDGKYGFISSGVTDFDLFEAMIAASKNPIAFSVIHNYSKQFSTHIICEKYRVFLNHETY